MSSNGPQAGTMSETPYQVAVLVPCYNEERAIAKVVADFRAALPDAAVYVYDNNSTDRTVEAARGAGAVVRRETYQGKGHVVRRMFNDVEADIYVLVDGDATYDAPSAPAMIAKLLEERLDMVVAARIDQEVAAYRRGHRAGNRLLTGFVAHMFGRSFTDILSGYRAFSRRFVKSFPILSGGFEIETELTIHALELELPVGEVATPYYSRPIGSASKLSTLQRRLSHPVDGLEALPRRAAAVAVRRIRPRARASCRSASQSRLSSPTCRKVWSPRLPTAVLSTGLMLLGFLSIACGLILDTVTRGRRELKLLAYLALRAPGEERRRS